MVPFERERTLSKARELMEAYLEERGWVADLETQGTDLVTTLCWIRRASGEIIASGYGKGHPEIARVGALYEAVEHYYGRWENADVDVTCVPAREILQDPRFAGLPCLSEFRDQGDRRVACAPYRDFRSGAAVNVPLFLVFPQYAGGGCVEGDEFDYSAASRFSSNSGTAIGATFEEAAIHALNELIERDAWSLFLLSHFFDTHPRRQIGRLVAADTVPEDLGSLLALASKRAKREILLIDITSDVGIATFAATVDRLLPDEHVHPYGFGTSTYPFYAAYRAITELLQTIDLKERSEQIRAADKIILQATERYRKLRDCVHFKVDRDRLKRRAWDYPSPPRRSLATLLSETLAQLEAHGIDLCFHVHREVPDLFCVVSYTSFALERFFLVTSGVQMAPGPRGMRLFDDPS
jgi:ribosomal protein S12 methylthiotransferase accessory factor